MTLRRPVPVDTPLTLDAGRLLDADGELLAVARATWIALQR